MYIAVYLRKSRSDPDDESIEETLSRHKKTLLQFAEENGLIINEIYEEVVSGDGLFVRPQMIRMLSDIESDKYDGILCIDIDRLGRVDTKDRGIILDTFKTHSTKIITPRKIYDLNDEIDEFSTEIQMLLARQELKKITQRMQAGIRRTLEDGYHVGEPPFGYCRTYINKRPTLKIKEDEAQIVRKIYDMYVNEHIGSRIIAETLNALGYKTRKKSIFSRNTVRFILQNEVYIGKIIWNKKKHIKKKLPTDKHRFIQNPHKEWIVVPGIHEAIIDEDTFKKAQEIRTLRSHPPSNTGEVKNPFAGLIYCKNCKSLMSRQASKKTSPRLLCPQKSCNKSTYINNIEVCILDSLKEYLKNFKIPPVKNDPDRKKDQIDKLLAKISEMKKQLSVLSKQKDSLHDLLEQGVYDIETFRRRDKIIKNNTVVLTELLTSTQAKLNEENQMLSLSQYSPVMEDFINYYSNLSAGEKNILLKKMLNGITYFRPHENDSPFEIELFFKDWI